MHKYKQVLSLLSGVFLTGCATPPPPDPPIWLRLDGKSSRSDPVLAQQFETDRTICLGQAQQSAVGAPIIYYSGLAGAINASMIQQGRQSALLDVAKGCMAQRGYVLVPTSQAEAKLAELAANAKRQTVAEKGRNPK